MPVTKRKFPNSLSKTSRPRTRKRQIIVETLRQEIVSGRVTPGGRMPSHLEIARRFGASRVTAQWALRHLSQDGFIRTRARSGTFVVDKPPHLNNYALVFFNDPASGYAATQWSRYYMALSNEAVALQRQERCRMLLFHGVDEHRDGNCVFFIHRQLGSEFRGSAKWQELCFSSRVRQRRKSVGCRY